MQKIKNSIEGLEQGSFVSKLVYTLFLVFGILFFVASLSTFYSIYSLFQSADTFSDLNTKRLVLSVLYISLNFIVGYGFVFCKKWIIPLFALNALLMGSTTLYSQYIVPNEITASTTMVAFLMSFVLLLITYPLRRFLNDSLYKKWVDLTYVILLLITFILTYLI